MNYDDIKEHVWYTIRVHGNTQYIRLKHFRNENANKNLDYKHRDLTFTDVMVSDSGALTVKAAGAGYMAAESEDDFIWWHGISDDVPGEMVIKLDRLLTLIEV